MDSREFRKAMSQFATGVTVVTGLSPKGEPLGLTVNAFASLSLSPPLVLVCLARKTRGIEAFVEGEHFAVNVLASDQCALSIAFSGPLHKRFQNVAYVSWDTGCPILEGCVANLECSRHEVHDGGDHLILIGRVIRLSHAEQRQPLVFFRAGYCGVGGSAQ